MKGWIGVDFDGTLAHYDKWVSASHCGEPIVEMVMFTRGLLGMGHEVRVFTARVWPIISVLDAERQVPVVFMPGTEPKRAMEAMTAAYAIQNWCVNQFNCALPITCVKDFGMMTLYDDRAVQVVKNSGRLVEVRA